MDQVRYYRTLAVIALSGFIATLDNNVVNVALPSIQRDLRLTVPALEWVVTSYILGFSSLLLVGGRLADQIGRRRTLLCGVAVFTAASVAAGLAGSGTVLVAARAVQGTGAGLMMPAALALMAADLDARQRDAAAGAWMASIASALALGPAVGGVVTHHWSWSWIFYLNVPVGALCVLLLPREAGGRAAPRVLPGLRTLDLPGAVLSASVLCGLTYALVTGPVEGFGSLPVVSVLGLTAAAALLLAVVEARSRSPLVDLGLFRDRAFSGGTAAQLLWGVGVTGVYFFTSLFMQDILGFSPVTAGMAFAPLAVLLVLTTPVAVRLSAAFGARWVVSVGLLAVSAGLLLVSTTGRGATYWDLQPGFALIGVGSGLITPLVTVVLIRVPPARAGVAAGMVSAVREASGIFGVVLVGAVLTMRQDDALRAGSPPDAAFLLGYAGGLRLAAALVLAGAVVTALTLGRAGRRPRRSAEPEDVLRAPVRADSSAA
jgi:EmrB/QacA subfamily drug resistance transporter